MDDLLKELRNYLADAKLRTRADEERTRTIRDGFTLLAKSLDNGFLLISNTILDANNRR